MREKAVLRAFRVTSGILSDINRSPFLATAGGLEETKDVFSGDSDGRA